MYKDVVFVGYGVGTYELGFEIYSNTKPRICLSISLGWSPTGIYPQYSINILSTPIISSQSRTFVKPGKSTSVRSSTFGL